LKEKSRTSVFVAHRLRTIFDSDRIIVLQAGQVAESGTHNQLLLTSGLYSELWKAQESMFDEEGAKDEHIETLPTGSESKL
jgi:ATP-binding cassette, subfamily B (MDR/TAP), member 7